MDDNHNLLTLYSYLSHRSIPGDCSFLHLVNSFYNGYKAFYDALQYVKTKNIEEILYDSNITDGLCLIISLKHGSVDKFKNKLLEGFDENKEGNDFSINITNVSDNKINVIITENIDEFDYYELRFKRYRQN